MTIVEQVIDRQEGRTFGEQVVDRLSEMLQRRVDRRGFLARVAVVATALVVDPLGFILRPRTAYASVCGEASSCDSGWTVFCCTVNDGRNECPPGSFVAGWWRADGSPFCQGGSRYIIDCNAKCSSPCSCHCPTGTCDNRRTCCNQFRYGQCHQEIACYGPVVCRVVTCTPPWVWDPSCTATVAVSNATSTHNAPCLGTSSVADAVEGPAVGRLADGRLELVQTAPVAGIRQRQLLPGGSWTPWRTFPADPVRAPKVGTNADGRLEVFYLGVDQRVHHYWRIPAGDWSAPVPLGSRSWPNAQGLSVTTTYDGRLEVFVVDGNRALWHAWQVSPGGAWTDWASLGGAHWANPAVERNHDGRLEVFTVGPGRGLYSAYQISTGAWYGWLPLGGDLRSSPAAIANADGRLEVFAVGPDRGLWHTWQTSAGGSWAPWRSLGGTLPESFAPAVARNHDGRLEVFTRIADGTVFHRWQVAPGGGWGPWTPLVGGCPPQHHPVVATYPDGRLAVLFESESRELWITDQVVPGGGWTPRRAL